MFIRSTSIAAAFILGGFATPAGAVPDGASYFGVTIGGDGFGYAWNGPLNDAEDTLSARFPVKGYGTDPYGKGRLSYSDWSGTLDLFFEGPGTYSDVAASGIVERFDALLPGSEDDFLTLSPDRTWVCTGLCELAVQDRLTGEWFPSGKTIASGTYRVSLIPLPATGVLLMGAMAALAGWGGVRRAGDIGPV